MFNFGDNFGGANDEAGDFGANFGGNGGGKGDFGLAAVALDATQQHKTLATGLGGGNGSLSGSPSRSGAVDNGRDLSSATRSGQLCKDSGKDVGKQTPQLLPVPPSATRS